MYHEKFEAEIIAEKCAASDKYKAKHKYPKDITGAEIIEMWNAKNRKAVERGKKFHAMQEEKWYKKGKNVFKHEILENGLKVSRSLVDLKPGVYPELMLYNLEYNIVGQSDEVEIYDNKEFSIRDWKTNETLDFEGVKIFDPTSKTKKQKLMYQPLHKYPDCNGTHYQVQLSLYAWMLEQFGYKCRDLLIKHAIFEEIRNEDVFVNEIHYPLDYAKKDIKNLLIHFKNKTKI
jgi:hypothetical protein